MRVIFANERLQAVCESEAQLRRDYGDECAERVMARLTDLRAAATLEQMRNAPGRCRPLDGERDGQISISVGAERRLVIEPCRHRTKAKGSRKTGTWSTVEEIRVVEICGESDE